MQLDHVKGIPNRSSKKLCQFDNHRRLKEGLVKKAQGAGVRLRKEHILAKKQIIVSA